jgi:hypothetical protein
MPESRYDYSFLCEGVKGAAMHKMYIWEKSEYQLDRDIPSSY